MSQLIIYLNSGKCGWGKCIFCGWGKHEYPKKSMHELKYFLDEKLRKAENIDILKIFNSGSFLDERQIPASFRRYLVKKCEEKGIKTLVIESRGEFITKEFMDDMKSDKVRVTIGIGLEVADDDLLKKLNKGITVKDYEDAAKKLVDNDFGVRSYILVNAPFTNQKSLDKTVELALKYSDSICLLNWFPHGKSEAFNLWLEGKWRPFTKEEFDKATKGYTDKKIEKYFEEFVFAPRFPQELQNPINGATKEALLHPHFEVWQDYISRIYERPKEKDIAFFTMCTFRKPYCASRFFKSLLPIIEKKEDFHIIVISTPGVVPFELSNNYPFNRYDWPEWEETDEIKKLYLKVTQERIENYLKTHKYKKYYCYLKPTSESYQALHNACDKLKIKLIDVLSNEAWEKVKDEKNPLSLPTALEDVEKI